MAANVYINDLVIGQRVTCALRWAGRGIITAIHGEQRPYTIGTMGGGVASYGGNATFDVAFESGSHSRHVPESIIRGIQWTILDEVADADEIMQAILDCRQEANDRAAKAKADSERRASERAKHLRDNKHLTPKSAKPEFSPGRLAAANIRIELKRAFPQDAFSVRSDFNSVDIRWTDGPTSDQVEEIVKKYQAGSFNGMEDIYENNPDATFADVFGDPNYVNCQRSYTLRGIKAAWMLAGRDVKEIPEDYCENGWKMPNDGGRRIREVWSDTSL